MFDRRLPALMRITRLATSCERRTLAIVTLHTAAAAWQKCGGRPGLVLPCEINRWKGYIKNECLLLLMASFRMPLAYAIHTNTELDGNT